jgi:D-alanine-D-alanine ligase
MKIKKKVAILCGGKSAEHEVSLLSAKNVIEAIDRDSFEVVLIGVDKTGVWRLCDPEKPFLNTDSPKEIKLNTTEDVVVMPSGKAGELWNLSIGNLIGKIDVVFPIMHGPFGEDGTVQGLLRLVGVPFVGAGVIGSAVGMDKDIMKKLLNEAGIAIARFQTIKQGEDFSFEEIKERLGIPLFIKPANMGSSVGINKVNNETEFDEAVKIALKYDTKVIVEEYIKAREIECAVLGNNNPVASELGEIIPSHDFYSYEAKYLDENGAKVQIPANISPELKKKIQEMAVKVFLALDCRGLGRVDFFLEENGDIKVIEINTIPGFTNISMFPTLWGISGIKYTELISKLIEFALEDFERLK